MHSNRLPVQYARGDDDANIPGGNGEVDSVSARFPDRHVRKYVIRFNNGDSDSQEEVPGTYSTNHVYLHRPNAFGFWQTRLHLCYETLKRVSNFSELA